MDTQRATDYLCSEYDCCDPDEYNAFIAYIENDLSIPLSSIETMDHLAELYLAWYQDVWSVRPDDQEGE